MLVVFKDIYTSKYSNLVSQIHRLLSRNDENRLSATEYMKDIGADGDLHMAWVVRGKVLAYGGVSRLAMVRCSKPPPLLQWTHRHHNSLHLKQRQKRYCYTLTNFCRSDKGKGCGLKLLREVCRYMRERKRPLYLSPKSTRAGTNDDTAPPTQRQIEENKKLVRYYERAGFRRVDQWYQVEKKTSGTRRYRNVFKYFGVMRWKSDQG